jgi:hypothetical protein
MNCRFFGAEFSARGLKYGDRSGVRAMERRDYGERPQRFNELSRAFGLHLVLLEFGAGDAVAIIWIEDLAVWNRRYRWAVERRREILERVAYEVVRQKLRRAEQTLMTGTDTFISASVLPNQER